MSTIATIDLPKGEWRELIPELLQNVRQANNLPLVQSSLDALGYICDGIYQAVRGRADRSAPSLRAAPAHIAGARPLIRMHWLPRPQYPDNPDIMAGQANNILAAVAAGVNYEQPYAAKEHSCSLHRRPRPRLTGFPRRLRRRGGIGSAGGSEVKLKALVALNNSLQFVAQNFAQDV